MSLSFRFVSSLVVILFSLSCGSDNLLKYTGSRDTDQARYEAARKFINDQDFASAVTELEKITSGFRDDPKFVQTLAGAYAGKCGLTNFLDFSAAIGGVSANTPMETLMGAFTATPSLSPNDCYNAQVALETKYGTNSASRSDDVNFFLALIGMARLGTQLRESADNDANGAIDGTFASACTNNATNLLDSEVRLIGSGLGLLIQNIAVVTANIAGSDALTDLALLAGVCGAACTITDPAVASWNAADLNLMRDMIETDTFGIMGCNNMDPTTCCP
jgi:hypothetical protein